jgi:hypothetical protein
MVIEKKKGMMMKIMMGIIEKIKYYILIMKFKELKEYFEQDLEKYNSFDERNLTNEKRDLFMKISFITFFIILTCKIIHLLLLKFNLC